MGKITNEYLVEVIGIISCAENRAWSFCNDECQNHLFNKKLIEKRDYHFARQMRARFVSEWLRSGRFPSESENISYEFYNKEYLSSKLYDDQLYLDLLSLIEDQMMVEWAREKGFVRELKRDYSKIDLGTI